MLAVFVSIYKETKYQTNVLVVVVHEQSFFKNIFNTHCWSIASFLRQFNLIIVVMPILKIKFSSSLDMCFLLPRIVENRRGRYTRSLIKVLIPIFPIYFRTKTDQQSYS